MGRIKTLLIKRIAVKLIKEHGQEFSSQFDKNKLLVNKYTNVS
ncbi:30S ribosomal protein S17e, partial [Candidatus Woesearchaeota archaeon]|nr:30S ribosomal protein S17e [Candidatus Woesearchaeota archaeon]